MELEGFLRATNIYSKSSNYSQTSVNTRLVFLPVGKWQLGKKAKKSKHYLSVATILKRSIGNSTFLVLAQYSLQGKNAHYIRNMWNKSY